MTVETILLVLAVSASGRVSGELEEKRITFRDPEYGAVERLYLQLLPAIVTVRWGGSSPPPRQPH